MEKAIAFIKSQRMMAIATHDKGGSWIANLYIGADDSGQIYFISPVDSRHSLMILNDPSVAFSLAWFDANNHANRKGIQGTGTCRLTEDPQEIATAVRLHNENFPEFSSVITPEWIASNEWHSKVWVLKPSYLKYWDDEVYGENESEEFNLIG